MPTLAERAAVDRLLKEQEVRQVRVLPASGPAHQRGAVVLDVEHWDVVRSLARSRGVFVAQDRVSMGNEEAARLGAALRAAAPEAERAKEALGLVLGVLSQGAGLEASVSRWPQGLDSEGLAAKKSLGSWVRLSGREGRPCPGQGRAGRLSGCCHRDHPGAQPCSSSPSSSVSPRAPR
jgi:hypothetical protein